MVEVDLRDEPISKKMQWAARRVTTRPEDASYCLLGLFDINMPLLYGEAENAFGRLQEEVLKKYPDQSILTWTDRPQEQPHRPYLPQVPSAFRLPVQRPVHTLVERGDIIATARGLEIDVMFGPCVMRHDDSQTLGSQQFMAILSCTINPDPLPRIAIFLEPLSPGAPDTAYTRVRNDMLILLKPMTKGLVLQLNHRNEIIEMANMGVEYNPEQLSPSRILLAAVRPIRDLSKKRLGVYITTPGIKRIRTNISQWEMVDDAIILYTHAQDRGVRTMTIRVVFFLGNGNFGFFVLWGVPESPSEQEVISWVETWESFMGGKLAETDPSNMEWAAFEKAVRRYVRQCQTHSPARLATGISGRDFEVSIELTPFEFLGRAKYDIGIDIKGWEDRPISVINTLQVLAQDWI